MKLDKLMAIVIILLVILIPVYSSNAMAFGISVTKSTGTKLDGFFDGQGDNWTIEVSANADGKEVTEDMVTVKFGKLEEFKSCSAFGGSYGCVWDSGYTTASDKEYNVEVSLYDDITGKEDTATASIIVDGSNPEINKFKINNQEGKNIIVQYDVNDGNPLTSSGLSRIEFLDGGDVVKTLGNLSKYSASGTEELEIDKNGLFEDQSLTIKVYDKIGHVGEEESDNSVDLDLKAPDIDESTFNIGDNDEYLPGSSRPIDISIEIEEESGLLLNNVHVDLSSFGLSSHISADMCINVSENVYKCVWRNIVGGAQGSASITFSASDKFGNIAKKTITKNFKIDSIEPQIEFFGTDNNFEDNSYITPREMNIIKLELREAESGITKENIKVDFKNVNRHLGILTPDNCTQDLFNPDIYLCTWNIMINSAGPIFLVDVIDNTGNEASADDLLRASITLNADTTDPIINSVEVISLGNTYTERREYVQTGDFLEIIVNASDNVAVNGFADLTEITSAGDFREEAECEEVEDYWICKWETPQVRDGYIKSAELKIIIEDYSGNQAEEILDLEILDADIINLNPDYWRIGDVKSIPEALDKQTTKLIGQRVYFELDLGSTGKVKKLSSELTACTGETEFLEDSYLYGDYIVLEFKQFDSKDIDYLNYTCGVNIFTKKGKKATYYPEVEEVNLTVRFYNLDLGEVSLVLASKIKKEKQKIKKNLGVIKTLNTFLKWSRYICDILYALDGIKKIISIANSNLDELRATAFGIPAAIAGCKGFKASKYVVWFGSVEILDKFCKFVTCKHDLGAEVWGDWYQKYSGHMPLGVAPDKYDNLVMAVATLCIPAIVYNLEKFRQIQCRYVYCLENELPAGSTDVKTCRELRDYQECKYVYGNLFQLIPFVGVLNQILNIVKSMLSDPVALFRMGAVWGCGLLWCPTTNTGMEFCDFVAELVFLMDFYQDISSLYHEGKSMKKDYCSEVGL